MSSPTIMLTNDDGIDSVGFQRLYDELDQLGDVVAVAPAVNRSAVGRSIESEVRIEAHPLGYAVHGTPSACAVVGATGLDIDPDMVVSGINKGANLGSAMLGRSGTVGAAIEAAYLGLPAIAVSMYVPFERIQGAFYDYRPEPHEYDVAAMTARFLVDRAQTTGMFERFDYLNVNTPLTDDIDTPELRVTRPADGYFTVAEGDGDEMTLRDRQFELLYTGDVGGDTHTDRGALAERAISISPLALPHHDIGPEDREAVASLLTDGEEVPFLLRSD